MSSGSFFSSFNARHLAPAEVAESFIWSESFGKLVQNNHSIILGARGCGKTTLMKMLTLPALYNWDSPKAEDIRGNIPFFGVYISTDIYWNIRNEAYGRQLEEFGSFARVISQFAVTSNIFASLCDTFINIIKFEVGKGATEEKEIEISKALIRAWKLSNTIPQLENIKEALFERVDEVNQMIQDIIFNYSKDDKLPHPDFFNLSFESSLELVIPKFSRIYGVSETKKWALCFDELEFAPAWLREKLFSSLRSRTQFLLYKLSSSPILPREVENTLQVEYGATSGNDVQLIKMWTSRDNEEFSRQIIQAQLGERGNLEAFFGTNDIYNKSEDTYTLESDFTNELKELSAKDDSFKDFMISRKVDLEKPIPSNTSEKNTLYRKIKPIVYFRNAFIDSNRHNHKVQYRGRKKVPDLYFGAEILAKICDGNPRWLIGIVAQMLNRAQGTSSQRIPRIDQYNELIKASKRFKNVIANIPVGSCDLTIEHIIERVGEYYRKQVLGEIFLMDPKGTFVVDEDESKVGDSVVELLEKGVAQGAFILLDCEDDSFDFQVRGQRFKLSYLFAILYDVPLRVYNSNKLSDCLSSDLGSTQPSLF